MKKRKILLLAFFLHLAFVFSEAQTKEEIALKINSYLSILEESNSFSGTIIVAKNGTRSF